MDDTNESSVPPPAQPAANFGQGKRALVIDDDVTSRELVRGVLTKSGFAVTTADNGKEGWKELTPEGMPHIIISDAVMPEMNGLDFFREIRGNDETKNIPVLIVSARKNMEDTFLAFGADAFLAKPLETAQFLPLVESLLQSNPDPGPAE